MTDCSSTDQTIKGEIMSRWVTGITLKRYFGFTEHQMRKLRNEVGRNISKDPLNIKWLYNLDKVLENYKPKTAIPEHLIKGGNGF